MGGGGREDVKVSAFLCDSVTGYLISILRKFSTRYMKTN